MASTDRAREHPLGLQHLSGCVALSKAAHWNQNAADWRLMLEIGRGYGLSLADGTLAATTLTLPYGTRFAWVSMVLVLPEHRRKGYATRLLKRALAELDADQRAAVLDATPAGHEVYAEEGFRDTWAFTRFALKALRPGGAADPAGVRSLEPRDWSRIGPLDAEAFGADRIEVLRALAQRLPQAAFVAEHDGELAGFLLGRDGREASQLGPLVARNAESARGLLASALAAVAPPIFVDVVDRESALANWLEACGFSFQRPFTRMVRGAVRAPGDASLVCCPAGPELG
ncbi:MAG TPA: GNAT family N-acetyltransferase [Burkholderiales bacterium]|nr:GNAT family N-acetyltransferase [Burkholderiales bacterium]